MSKYLTKDNIRPLLKLKLIEPEYVKKIDQQRKFSAFFEKNKTKKLNLIFEEIQELKQNNLSAEKRFKNSIIFQDFSYIIQ